ncbi:MAG: U32 family peptidase [Lachnospiraceae bacterium]
MNILVPLNDFEAVRAYIIGGAKEFYIGFYDEIWEEKFGKYSDMNRMSGYGKEANRYSFEEMIAFIEPIHEMGGKLFVTFNTSSYSDEQILFLQPYLNVLHEKRVDGVIVACPELLKTSSEIGLTGVVSTIAGIYNADTARFYKELGAKRIIIPRDVSMEDMREMIGENPDIEYEVFMMRSGCRYSDSHCLGLHTADLCAFCTSLDQAKKTYHIAESRVENPDKIRERAMKTTEIFQDRFHNHVCGMCAIYDFVELGVAAGKVVGRTHETEEILKDIALISQNIEIAKCCTCKEEYLEEMFFPDDRDDRCDNGLSCYYPEVRF